MTREKIALLQEELLGLHLAAGHLGYSLERCQDLIGQDGLPPEQLERLESLTSRFARAETPMASDHVRFPRPTKFQCTLPGA